MTTILFGWGRMFDLPSPSPYVAKADMQLQLLGIEFDRAVADLDTVSKHKAPYVNDGGTVIEDSEFIRAHFERKTGRDLDVGLIPAERATARALSGMLENRLSTIMACERWLIDENFDRGPRMFFADVPEAMREEVIGQVRGDLQKSMHGVGIGRFTRDERIQIAAADIAAVAALLGDKACLFGARASAADAVAYGALSACSTRFFESRLPDLIAAHPTLSAYLARIEQTYFAEDRWPAMA